MARPKKDVQPVQKIVTVQETPKVHRERLKVMALRDGYYGIVRRKKGSVFTINRRSEFSCTWMKALNFPAPEPSENQKKCMGMPTFKQKFLGEKPFDTNKVAALAAQGQTVEYVETEIPQNAVTEVLPESAYAEELRAEEEAAAEHEVQESSDSSDSVI